MKNVVCVLGLIGLVAMAAPSFAGEGGWDEGFGAQPSVPTYVGPNTCDAGNNGSEAPQEACNVTTYSTAGWNSGAVDLTTPFHTYEEAAAHCGARPQYAVESSWDYGFDRMVYRCVEVIPNGNG